jgi:hypothetical protein
MESTLELELLTPVDWRVLRAALRHAFGAALSWASNVKISSDNWGSRS